MIDLKKIQQPINCELDNPEPFKMSNHMGDKVERLGWYDGWFYSKFISPILFGVHKSVLNFLDKSTCRFLDIGCGTGNLCLMVAENCKEVVGVDVSLRMINSARQRNTSLKIKFIHLNSADLSQELKEMEPFDFASMVMMLHELDQSERTVAVKEALKVSKRVIIVDYRSPFTKVIPGSIVTLIEYIAGKKHYNNFQNWIANGGVDQFVKDLGVNIIDETSKDPIVKRIIIER